MKCGTDYKIGQARVRRGSATTKEFIMNFKQKAAAAVATASTFAGQAFAVGPTSGDLSNLTPDMGSVLTAIGAVAVVLIGVNLAIKGYRIVSSLIGKR